MSNQSPEQTAIVALVPTEDASHLVELLNGANIPGATINTYVLPTDRQEAERLATRLAGKRVNRAAVGYEVTPHESKPTSIIKNIATNEAVEAITVENFQAVSRGQTGRTHVGAHLASSLFRPNFIRWTSPHLYNFYIDQYLVGYRPKFTNLTALRASKAPEVLARYDQRELDLKLSARGRALLAHVCNLIKEDTA